MLGFLRNVSEFDGVCYPRPARFARLVRTSASCPPLNTQRGWLALDARGGRVLLHRADADPAGIRLAVWDPLSAAAAGHLELPVPILPRRARSWNAALLCCDQHGLQDHADGPFRVVLVGTDPEGAFACVYSSFGPAAWSELAYAAQHPDPGDVDGGRIDGDRGTLVGNALYFLLQGRTSILKYDLATGDISVIPLPPASYSYIRWMSLMVLTTTEDGGLGFAGVVGYRLHLWSMVLRPNGGALAMGFTQGRTIDLSRLPPSIVLLGFVDGVGIILLGTIMSVDQKSGRTEKLGDGRDFYSDNCVVPYVSFYTPAFQQLQVMQSFKDHFPLTNSQDVWTSHWGTFSVKRTYIYLMGHRQIPAVYKWLWECFCQPKHKVFFWLLLKDRLSTRNILRKNMHLQSYNCVLCQLLTEETVDHLFLGCQFAKDCWASIGISLQNVHDIFTAIDQVRAQSHPNFFLMIAILMCWAIWNARNDFIFKNKQPSISAVKALFQKELRILSLRARAKLTHTFDLWIQNLL